MRCRPPAFTVHLLLAVLLLGAPTVGTAQASNSAERLFETGTRLLDAGDAAGAAAAYRAAAATGWTGAALEHNLGLAELQQGDVGAAVLHLRRAARLSPNDERIRQSLTAARAQAGFQAPPEGPGWRMARLAAWPAGVGGLLVVAALLGVSAAVRWRRPGARRSAYALGVAAAAVWVLAAAAWSATAPRGVVLAATSLRTAPSTLAPEAAPLAAGRGVRLGERVGSWQAARLPDGTEGWVPVAAVGDV